MDSGPGCGGVASFSIVFCDLSRVSVSPLLPDLNLSKVPRGRDSSGCSDLGSRRPRNPSLCLGLVTALDRAALSLEVPKKQQSAVSKEECLSWRQPGCLGSTSLRSLWSLPYLPSQRELRAALDAAQRVLPSPEQGGRAVWCSAQSDHLLLECSLGLPPQEGALGNLSARKRLELSPLTPLQFSAHNRCSIDWVCRQVGDLGSAPGDTHRWVEKVSGKWGLFPQVVMMFMPRLPDMGPGRPPHSQFLPSLLSIKSGGSLSLKCGTANVQASLLGPRNVKNNLLQKNHPESHPLAHRFSCGVSSFSPSRRGRWPCRGNATALWLLEPFEPEVHSPWNHNPKRSGLLLSCFCFVLFLFLFSIIISSIP